jgi:hypothetical protein
MGTPVDFAALDAMLAQAREDARRLAEAVREAEAVQAQSRALLEWWRVFRDHPSPERGRWVH